MIGKMLRVGVSVSIALAFSVSAAAQNVTDGFDSPKLDAMWTFRTPDGNDKYEINKGWFTFDIQANQDLFRQGIDLAPFLLTDPPADDTNFSIETVLDAVLDQKTQPSASHAGLVFFREDEWAYSLWGPYANTDIRLEDCVGGDYRWRDQAQIGVNAKADGDVWLKIVKTGDSLEFFWKDNEGDAWESAGVDEKLGPHYEKGTYKVGLFLKNWAGSVAMRAAFDYFYSPEIGSLSVDPHESMAVTWADLKVR